PRPPRRTPGWRAGRAGRRARSGNSTPDGHLLPRRLQRARVARRDWSRGRPMPRILVVDDEEAIRSGLAEVLREEGYDVEEVGSADQALKVMRGSVVDVMCTDVRMRGMDGLELLTKVKAESPDVEVIVITGFASLQSAVDAVKRGAEDYLAKPFDLDEVRL